MDRIIEIKVNGNHLTKDSRWAGSQGEANVTKLRIEFDAGWDGYAKKVTFWDALGQNPTERTLTADLLEDLSDNTRIYLCPIPGEALTEAGNMVFVIDGWTESKRQRSVEDKLGVRPARKADDAGEPVDPTPTQAEQLQAQIDTILQDMSAEADRAETAAEGAEAAKTAAETAQQKAEQAQGAAETAQNLAETAQGKAENAQTAAEQAQKEAETAQGLAETAQQAAEVARTGAENAQQAAQQAEGSARDSEAEAYRQASRAEQAADRAAGDAVNKVVDLLNQHVYDSTAAKDDAQAAAAAAAESAEDAADSAKAADEYAQSVNPDEIRSMIAQRGDGLWYDENTHLLYLTSGGEIISDGIQVASGTGGGGGGGESNNAVLTFKNTTGWMYKSISLGADCYFTGEWSSIEDEMPTGDGVLKVTVGGTVKETRQISQGAFSVNIGPMMAAGTNAVKINVTDTYGNSRSVNLSITAVSLELTSPFDASVVYEGGFDFPYVPTAAVTKTMHFLVDGKEIGTEEVIASGREQRYSIPAQSHGLHTIEAYYTAVIDGETVESDRLHYPIACKAPGDATPIIVMDLRPVTVEQFDTVATPWWVYDPSSLMATVTQTSGEGSKELTVDRTAQTWSYRPEGVGEDVLTISCVGAGLNSSGVNPVAVVSKTLTVTETSIDVEAETSGLSLYLASYGRSNSEQNPGEWTYGVVEAELQDFNFTSDGWQVDEDGATVLRVSGDARVNIPVQIFAQDFRSTGKTIEIEFASRSVLDYDAIIASCMAGGRGLEITAQQAFMYSEQSTIGTRYKEDEHVRLAFVVEKRSAHRLLLCYLNGILSGAAVYPGDDDFSQSAPVGISLGSNDCTIDIYNIRIYENDLNRYQLLDNWIADTQSASLRADRFLRNDIYDEYGKIVMEKLPQDLPYLVLQCAALPQYKGDKKICSGYYIDPANPRNSFKFTGAEIDVQGTSSQYYRVKNYKIKFKGGFILWNGTSAAVYVLHEDVVPVAEYTMKADVASQEGANNVILADLFNELCPVKTPAQEDDPRVRQTIYGQPIVIFWDKGDGNGPAFVGKYNFNNDKGTPEVFGFEEGDESWEILQNGTDRVGWRDPDFSGTAWKTDFEARYPKDNTDTTRLAAFAAWIASTDRDAVDTEEEKAARLQKFVDELHEHASVPQSIFYYLFTLVFLCIDQREKNAFPTWFARLMLWLWLFYDADSSLGKDNKGNHTFDYWLEDIDFTEGGDPIFNGQNSVFWRNLRDGFWDEIKAEYQRLRTELGPDGKPLLSYEGVIARYEAHQGKWPEAIYNEDGWKKSIEAWIEDGDTLYLPMLVGKAELWIKWWLYNRFRYMDSLFECGTSLTNRITIRAHAKADVTLISYVTMYGRVYFNADMVGQRMFKDQEYTFHWDASGAEDPVIGVNDADRLTSLGDLSPLQVELIDVSPCAHLTYIKLGDGAEGYSNTYLNSVTFGQNPLLVYADLRNCVNFAMAPDFSQCTNIEEIYLDGTAVTGATLPNGGVLKIYHLPGTVKNLTVQNQKMLQEFVLPSYSQIETLRIENTPVIPTKEILAQMAENSRVRLIGFDWTFDTAADILSLYDRLDTMRGLDENGGNVAKAQMSGTVRVENITGAQLSEMQSRYPDIKVVYAHITSTLTYCNWDGTVLATETVADGGDGKGMTATRASDAQYIYTHSGWSLTQGGAASANALKAVTADRTVYATYSTTLQKYTVTWKNGSTVLETDTGVPYGTVPTYNGSTPVDGTNGLAFLGWTPTPGPITGNTTYTAKFQSPVEVAEITDSWDTILANIDNGTYATKYKVGNYKPLDLGSEGIINMQIAAFDTDDLASGTGKAPVTFIAKELLTTGHAMNSDGSEDGWWEESDLRAYLKASVKPLIPANVQNRIATVKKTHMIYNGEQTTEDDVWVPSWHEEIGVYGGATQMYGALYSTNADRVKSKVGSSDTEYWWTRTGNGSYFYYVDTTGYFGGSTYGNKQAYGIALSFCLGTSEITDSWDEIFASIDDGSYKTKYSIGAYKPLDLGSEGVINMQIAAFDADTLADGTGTAAISWVAKELLATTYRMNPARATNDDGSYQTGTGSIGGWEHSEMRAYLNGTIKGMVPALVKNNVVSVTKTHKASKNNGMSESQTTHDEFWLASSDEVNGGIYSGLFPDNNSRKKVSLGGSKKWWLRNVRSGNSYQFYDVDNDGSLLYTTAETKQGIALGFCTGKSK